MHAVAVNKWEAVSCRMSIPDEPAASWWRKSPHRAAPDNQNHGTLLMSYFVASQFVENSRNNEQMLTFRNIRALFRGVPASIAKSGFFSTPPPIRHRAAGRGALRCQSDAGCPTDEAGGRLKARIAQVRSVEFRETRLRRDLTARRPSRIAVVTMGYADGFFRSASGPTKRWHLIVAGRPCPIVGRISMDLIALDITDLPNGSVRRGDFATVIGEGRDVDALGEMLGTIGYEVLTSLSRRFARIYRGGS
jgi:alanine racemase